MVTERGRFPARMEAFPGMADFLQEVARAVPLAHGDALRLRLVAEELFTNTCRYGAGRESRADQEPVEVQVTVTRDAVELAYVDAGPPHDPRVAFRASLGLDAVAEERVGGVGIRLVSGFARHLRYEYVDGRNRVTVTLPRDGPAGEPAGGAASREEES
jgi:anti-sigma regulatory factor (Ser/Thr protein kinase)